jgi:hypothetical protein
MIDNAKATLAKLFMRCEWGVILAGEAQVTIMAGQPTFRSIKDKLLRFQKPGLQSVGKGARESRRGKRKGSV